MLGLGLALALAVTAPPTMPSAAVTCPGWPASCDGAWGPTADDVPAGADEAADDGPREYATPVEIDCPTPPEAPTTTASGECTEPPVLNLWYRVSRSPDGELPAGSLVPAPRRARTARSLSAGGAPDVGHLSAPDVQPAALCALPGLAPADAHDGADVTTRTIILRAIAPPDRPPRA
ncbi:MAG TPA: hypothetical protein VI456_14655 [Polyangia bacterium]